jgi:murein DD-endopeptidase MepM/ murein hydrolase activator NlpD
MPRQWLQIIVAMLLFEVGAAPSVPQSLPIDVSIMSKLMPVRCDSRWHALYEVRLTNFRSKPIELTRVEISTDNERLQAYDGSQLDERISNPGMKPDETKRSIAGGETVVLFLDVMVPSADFGALVNSLTFSSGGESATITRRFVESDARPAVLQPPLRGEMWLAMNGFSNDSGHRRTIIVVNGKASIAQRYATDWTRLGPDGQAFHGDPANNENWYAYGAPVLAVEAGTVTDLRDGIPENNPASDKKAVPIDLETVAGNYIIVQIAPDRFALYAHLQPHGLLVKLGEKVKSGQVLARLGNSGNSDAPHLHFHVCDSNSPLGCEGVSYAFTTFTQLGEVPSLEVLTNGKGWHPSGDVTVHKLMIPARNAVVRF